jgi:hypothetical protein
MRISLLYKIIFVNIFMVILSFILPTWNSQHIELILIPATFLFGTLYGFEIFIVLDNFSQLKKLLAKETANLVYIYHIAKTIDGSFAKQLEEKIENYILTSIDYSLKYHISSTDQDFSSIAEPLEKMEIKETKHKIALEAIHRGFHNIVDARYQLSQVAPREVGIPEWIMLILLGAILIVELFLGRDVDPISKVSLAVFAATVVGTLFLLDEADSNHIQETRLEYEIFNQVLEDIGKSRYYPKFAIRKGIIRLKKKGIYRIGKFPNYPDLSNRQIEIIET